MNVFIASDFHIMQHLIRPYTTVLHVCIDFVFSLSLNSLLLDAWFSQIILTWSFPYLEMSAVYRCYSINANTTIDIVYIAQWQSTRLQIERSPVEPLYVPPVIIVIICMARTKIYPGRRSKPLRSICSYIQQLWSLGGGGRGGQKRLCHISCSSKLYAGAKRLWGVIGHVLKGGQPPTLPPKPFVENSFVTGIYTYQARFILIYRQIDNIYIYLCVLSSLYLNSRFLYIFRASTCTV